MVDASHIKEHMEVKASDGQHVGTVDHMQGADQIKLTRNDTAAQGEHHLIPLTWVHHVDAHVHLSKSSEEVTAQWKNPG